MKTSRAALAVLALVASLAAPHLTLAHCQVPCGIYDVTALIDAMYVESV
jgi:hypothetical protein